MNRRTLLLALLTGVLLVLVFPKWGLSFLVWIALIPLFLALEEVREGDAFRIGFVAGTVFNVGLLYWITHVVGHYGSLPIYLAVAIMLFLAMYLALYMGLFALCVVFLRKSGLPLMLVAPVLWTSLEYLKSHLLTGFPWENLGYSLHEHITVIQVADITGVYGLSFLIVWMNCVVYELLRGGGRRRALCIAVTALLVMTSVFAYGSWRIHSMETYLKGTKQVTVALVQGNIDQSIKWNPEYQRETIEIYGNLSRQAAEAGNIDFIVWPETAAPLFFQDRDDNHRAIVAVARDTSTPLLFGSPAYGTRNGKRYLKNSAWFLDGQGTVIGRYDKVHLVPFGEYVPLRRILFFVDKLVEGFADFRPGESVDPLELNGVATGVLICYEGIFPGISRAFVSKGADILVNITNDAWYGRTSAPYQHLSMVPLRAVENRRSVARAANTGICALVDPLGRVTSESGLFTREVLSGTLNLSDRVTFYTKFGDLFALTCLVLSGLVLVIMYCLRRKLL